MTIAFLAGGHVEDTRDGLISEVVALLTGLAGVCLIMYGWVAPSARAHARARPPVVAPPQVRIRSANELLFGGAGLGIAAVLIIGIGLSAGVLSALMGFVMLLPMSIGCAYLCLRFFRAPEREWKIDLQRLTHHR